MLSFFPRGVLDEILNLIESVSEGFPSYPKISSKLQYGIYDPKGLENKIYTMTKSGKPFYGEHTVPITSCSKVQIFHTSVSIN